MSVNIHLPSTPRHLKITPTMVDDFLVDPVLGVYVIFGCKLDVFQQVRLRILWWTPNVIDSSGFGTGKSLTLWLFMNLRCVIIGDQHVCTYYQDFQAGKDIYWPYYNVFDSRRAPIFNAQLGKLDAEGDVDGKDNSKGPACYKQYFKNESVQFLPAPGWFQGAKGQAGRTFNVASVDEWTKVETMTKKTGRITNEKGDVVGGINQQILGRVRRASWNQFHPLWGNHRVFLATAESMNHPAYRRYKNFMTQIKAGDPTYALFSASFKDFSNLTMETDIRIEDCECRKPQRVISPPPVKPCGACRDDGRVLTSTPGKPFREVVPDWATIASMKAEFTTAHYKREVLGIWARETRGWYSEDALEKCVRAGFANNLQPETARPGGVNLEESTDIHYFMGIDPAPAQSKTADDGAMAVMRARPRPGLGAPPTSNVSDWLCEFVWAYRVRGEVRRQLDEGTFFANRTREWSGLIHGKHQHFGLSGLLMDKQGGGAQIITELNKTKQLINGVERECMPIATADDITAPTAQFILNLYMRRDDGISMLWPILQGDDNLYEAMHIAFQEAVEHALVSFPLPFNDRPAETTKDWPIELRWALINLDAARQQMLNVQALTDDAGMWTLTRNGAKTFTVGTGKKDLAYACIFAYVRFLIWLKKAEFDFSHQDDDETGVYKA